jgi:hypothetical protein
LLLWRCCRRRRVHQQSVAAIVRTAHGLSKLANSSEEGICAMASLYSTNAAASSDPHGSIRSEDGLLDLKFARPCVLCGRDDATNPEQLFAGGYAACFDNALLYVTWDAGHRSSDDDIDAVAAQIEMRQEASCWSPRLQ